MSDTIENAQEGLEHAHHAAEHGHGTGDYLARNMAVIIAALAACLALTEMGEKAAQNEYLTHHISVSDTYAFLQARNVRAGTLTAAADVIESMPVIDDAAHKRVAAMRAEVARLMDDPKGSGGRKQLLEKAKVLEAERDHAFHIYHQFERATGALQIAIVLASVSVVTRTRALSWAGGLIGGAAALYGLLVATEVL
jgi:hypothetical protein